MQTRAIDFDKIYLHKEHDFCGETPLVTFVFLHGIASDATTYNSLLEYLEAGDRFKDARFVTFDLLGSGKSIKADDELDYGIDEQMAALENSIKMLEVDTPIVLVGHSMGTIIATRFADTHRRMIDELILISPPVYRPDDFKNPLFEKALDGFREVVGRANPGMLGDKAFNNELKNIVANPHNYEVLSKLNKPISIVYGELDQIIAPFNIPKLLDENPMVTASKTAGRHGVNKDKFAKIANAMERKLASARETAQVASDADESERKK